MRVLTVLVQIGLAGAVFGIALREVLVAIAEENRRAYRLGLMVRAGSIWQVK